MTLARRPSIILLDEPCATLPSITIHTVISVVDWARTAWNAALVVVEHRSELFDWASTAPLCTTREMHLGRLLAEAEVAVAS